MDRFPSCLYGPVSVVNKGSGRVGKRTVHKPWPAACPWQFFTRLCGLTPGISPCAGLAGFSDVATYVGTRRKAPRSVSHPVKGSQALPSPVAKSHQAWTVCVRLFTRGWDLHRGGSLVGQLHTALVAFPAETIMFSRRLLWV
jgi:hypothetical protein